MGVRCSGTRPRRTWNQTAATWRETPQSIEEKTVPVAQTYGERAVAGGSSETDLTTISETSTQLVPATEQARSAVRERIVGLRPICVGAPPRPNGTFDHRAERGGRKSPDGTGWVRGGT